MELNLKDLRIQRDYSQKTVAFKSNITTAMYNLIENGKRCPSVKIAKRIAGVLNFDWTKFFE